MKKFISVLLFATMMMGFTSCIGGDDNDEQTQEFSSQMYNRIITGEDVQFSTSNYSYKINYTKGTISVKVDAYLNGTEFTAQASDLTLNYSTEKNAYTFSGKNEVGGIVMMNGTIDLNTGVIYINYNFQGHEVFATTTVPFFYCNTETVNEKTGSKFSTKGTRYQFVINTTKKTAALIIYNLQANQYGNVYSSVYFPDIKYTVTEDGYEFTAEKSTSTATEQSTVIGEEITDLNMKVENQGLNMAGAFTFKSNGENVKFNISGEMFGKTAE